MKTEDSTYFVLGRQPKLGIAELESIFGAHALRQVSDNIAEVRTLVAKSFFKNIGGSVKMASLMATVNTTDWKQAAYEASIILPQKISTLPDGKVTIGLSVYGSSGSPAAINATALNIKKAIRQSDKSRSVRVVPNKSNELNTAQILHNGLLSSNGIEIILIRDNNQFVIAQTTAIQDIEAYSARDHGRPKRDAFVGMLPPKLAQIIINLSGAKPGSSLLDPFCGTGVLLQEALLMGINAFGSDIESRMIDYSDANLKWLQSQPTYPEAGAKFSLQVADATEVKIPDQNDSIQFLAAETYLGRPFSHEPKTSILREVVQDVDTIHKKFLANIASQTSPGFRLCIAVPAWHTNNGIMHLPMLDRLTEMGYTRMSFAHANNLDLIYHREGQIVGRELVVLIRK